MQIFLYLAGDKRLSDATPLFCFELGMFLSNLVSVDDIVQLLLLPDDKTVMYPPVLAINHLKAQFIV